jgi:hypothetical protein
VNELLCVVNSQGKKNDLNLLEQTLKKQNSYTQGLKVVKCEVTSKKLLIIKAVMLLFTKQQDMAKD